MSNPRTILIVDDCDDIRQLVSTMLAAEGHQVFVAANGSEALSLLDKDIAPHLILLDMRMPVMDGWQFSAAYRQSCKTPAPIVVVSAAGNLAQRGMDAGAVHWMEKPFALEDLLSVIERFSRSS